MAYFRPFSHGSTWARRWPSADRIAWQGAQSAAPGNRALAERLPELVVTGLHPLHPRVAAGRPGCHPVAGSVSTTPADVGR